MKKSDLSQGITKENAEKAIQYIHETEKKINWVLEDADVQETVKNVLGRAMKNLEFAVEELEKNK